MASAPESILKDKNRPFNGKEYISSLQDDREIYIYGERVKDVTKHPAFRNSVQSIAKLYDALHQDSTKKILTTETDTGSGGYTHRFFKYAKNSDDLFRQRDAMAEWAKISYGWMGRTPDYKASFTNTLGANPDFYGKFSTNWENNGDSSYAQLSPWLNPSDSTLSYIDGIYFSCNASADFTTAGIGSSINFFGSASSNIESWNWNFDVNENVGVSPVNSDLQNPSNIIFDSSGIYLVSLLVTNNFGKTCTSSLEINVINTTDVKPILENEIKVFPNPNNGRFKIEFKDYTAHRQGFYIYNQLGKIIKSFKHIE